VLIDRSRAISHHAKKLSRWRSGRPGAGSLMTHRWRGVDSNHRSRPTGGAFEAAPCWFRRTSEPASNPPWRARNKAFGL
jgi:hypothetical protein